MHELPVTEQIIDLCSRTAEEHRGRVQKITLVVGEDSGFVGESIQMYFDVMARHTPCEGAVLEIIGVKPRLRCRDCGGLFERKLFSFACPKCGGEGEPTEQGKEFYIRDIELDVPDEN